MFLDEHPSRRSQQIDALVKGFNSEQPYVNLILYKSEADYWVSHGLTYDSKETTPFDEKLGLSKYKMYFTEKFNPEDFDQYI